MNIFPNPANDLLLINLPSSAKQISIVDIYGKLINSEPALLEFHELKISSLASGTYWLKVDLTNGRTALKRFIKQ